MKTIKSNFLKVCLGISVVFFSLGFFVLTVNQASASSPGNVPTPKDFIVQGTPKIGKYACSMAVIPEFTKVNGQINRASLNMVILDTETGKTVTWFCSTAVWQWEKFSSQLPVNPF